MGIDVRAMVLGETGAIIEFFHGTTPEHLAMLIVDPRLPPAAAWRERDERENALAIERRTRLATAGCSNANMSRLVKEAGLRSRALGRGKVSLKSDTPSPVWFVESPTRCGTFTWSHAR